MFISKSFSSNRRNRIAGFAAQQAETSSYAGLRTLLWRFMGRLGRRRVVAGALEHLATLPLGAQSSLVLIRWGKETLLLGTTAQHISLLAKNPSESMAHIAPDESLASQEQARS